MSGGHIVSAGGPSDPLRSTASTVATYSGSDADWTTSGVGAYPSTGTPVPVGTALSIGTALDYANSAHVHTNQYLGTVLVTGTAVSGYAPIATGAGTATWQAVSGGGSGLIVQEADGSPAGTATTLILPNGTLAFSSGTATYTPSGGGGSVAATATFAIMPLDRTTYTGLDATYGDDLDGAALNGRWTRQTQTSGEESYQDGPRASALRIAYSTGAASRYIYQGIGSLGTSWTFEASASIRNGTSCMTGIHALDSSQNGVGCFLYYSSPAFYLGTIAAGGYSSIGASVAVDNVSAVSLGQRVWYRMRRSGSVYYASFSIDGETYSAEISCTPSAFTQSRIAFGRVYGTTSGHMADLHWFDKTA